MGRFRPNRKTIQIKGLKYKIELEVYEWAKEVWKREGFQSVEALLIWIYKGADMELNKARGKETNESIESCV